MRFDESIAQEFRTKEAALAIAKTEGFQGIYFGLSSTLSTRIRCEVNWSDDTLAIPVLDITFVYYRLICLCFQALSYSAGFDLFCQSQINCQINIHACEYIIAVGHNNLYRVLTQTQLSNCQKHYQKFLCETPLITNTKVSTTCQGSLMDHNSIGIQTHCTMSTILTQESVFQITHNQLAIYSNRSRTMCQWHSAVSTTTMVMVSLPAVTSIDAITSYQSLSMPSLLPNPGSST